MKISKECLDEARTALKEFSADELKEYAHDVFDRAKKYSNLSNAKAFAEAAKEINNERLNSYFESVMTAANNSMKINAAATRIKSGKANLQNTLIKLHGNQGDNVAASQAAAREKLEASFFNKVTHEDVEYLSSGENDLAIADAFDGKKVDSKEANLVAKLWKEVYFPERNASLITSNAMPLDHINQDRSFRNVHDSNKILLGGKSGIDIAKSDAKYDPNPAKARWKDWITKHFDLIHSDAIDSQGNIIDEAKYSRILDDMFDNITTGRSDIFTRSIVANDRVAIQNRSRRRLQPKSMRSFVEYNREYGQGNLVNAMLIDMQSSGNKIGMAQLLGDSPHVAYLELRKAQQEANPKKQWWMHHADLYFNEIMGANRTAVSPTLAAIDANVRAVTAMARLPLVTLKSLPDINSRAIFAMNHGVNYFEAWGNHLKNIFDLYPSKDRKYLAKTYGSMFRSHLGYMARYGETNNISESLNKWSTRFFKANLLHSFDNGGKMSGIELASRGLARNAGKKFDNLPLATKNWVAKFLNPDEWELLRGKTQGGLFTVDNVNALTDKEIKQFYEVGSKERPLHEIRNDLYRKTHAMAQIAAENMILNPGAFERAFMLQGTKPGTPIGVLMRQLSHFKTFTLSYLDKVLVQGYKTADANQQKLAWATATLVGTLPLAYGTAVIENILMNKTMPDFSKMNVSDKEKFVIEMLAPGLALFSGVLDPRNQNSNMLISLFASPSIRLIGNAMSTLAAIATGNPKGALKHFEDTMSYVVPIKTFPILPPILQQVMGDKAQLQPGQQHIIGR